MSIQNIYNMTAISNDVSIFIPVGSFNLEDFYFLQYVDKIPVAGGIKEDILDENPYHLSLDIRLRGHKNETVSLLVSVSRFLYIFFYRK